MRKYKFVSTILFVLFGFIAETLNLKAGYDPSKGRFINRDPIEEEGGFNVYAFVLNDPINYWDYLGMRSFRIVTKTETATQGMRSVKEISSQKEIYIKSKPSNISQGEVHATLYYDGGTDETPPIDDLLSGKKTEKCRVNVYIWIEAMGPSVVSGQTYFYREHYPSSSWMDGGVGFEPLGAVVSHEKGHAKAFWEKVALKIKAIVDKYKGDGAFTSKQMSDIDKAFKRLQESRDYIISSIRLSNYGTRGFYSPHRFTRIYPASGADIGNVKTTITAFGKKTTATDVWVAK